MSEIIEAIKDTPRETSVAVFNRDIDKEFKITELGVKKEELESYIQDRKERKRYANKLFYFLSVFVFIILLIVILSGLDIIKLETSIMITLITTTTANIISIFIYVVKYLFKSK